MKKLLRRWLPALLAFSLLLSAAAETAAISDREKAVLLADRAMEEKYGITLLTQEYFERLTEEKDGGVFIVTYTGLEDWAYVLGTYRITVKEGAVAEITWSRDGEDTSGGFAAEAWGSAQITEMLRLNQETGDISLFSDRIDEINRKHGLTFPTRRVTESEAEAQMERETAECEEIRRSAAFSREEIDGIAKQAIIQVYGLSEEEADQLENLLDEEEGALWYEYFHGLPCFKACYALGDDENDGDLLPNGIHYTEKEGTYWVYVNVLTGVAEELFYSPGIGGNG